MNTKNSHFYQLRHSVSKRILASLVILAFFLSQTIPSGFADITLSADARVVPYQPETEAAGESANSQQRNATPVTPVDPNATFLQDQLHLVPSASQNPAQTTPQNVRDAEEYSFDQAADSLTPDYAAAVIVKDVTAEDLRNLVREDVEVGIAVIRGKIVMFTTGSLDELRANPVAQNLLQESSLIIHTHPVGTRSEPSPFDFEQAGSTVEYVITENGVYAYNHDGLITPTPMSEEDLAALIETAHTPEASSVEARAVLNQFIASVDEYNTNPEQYSVYRSAQPISNLTGYPALSYGSKDGLYDPATSQQSSSEFSVSYNVSTADSYSWAQIDFSSTPGGSQNLSGIGYFSYDIKSDHPSSPAYPQRVYKLEFVDVYGNVGSFALPALNATYTNVAISIADIRSNFPDLKLDQIKKINFVFENNYWVYYNGVNTRYVTTVPAATLGIKIGGLSYAPVVSGTTYNQSAITQLPNYPSLSSNVGTAGGTANGTITQSQTSGTTYNFNYTLADNDDFVFSQLGWGYFDSAKAFQGSAQNLGTSLVLAVNGPSGKSLKVEVLDKNGLIADFYLTLSGTTKNYTLALTGDGIPTGFDATNIALINLVADRKKMGASGTVTVETKGLITPVTGTGYNSSAITTLPNYPALSSDVGTSGAVANGTITQTQTSGTNYNFNYTLADDDDFVYSQVGWGYFTGSTFTGSSQNLGTSLVLAVNGPAGKQLVVEVWDSSHAVKKFALNLTGSNQNYTLDLTGLDTASIAMVNLVADKKKMGASGTVAVETKGLVPAVTGTSYSQSALTALSNSPALSSAVGTSGATANGTIIQTQASATNYSFNYTLADSDDFVYSQTGWGYFQDPGVPQISAINYVSNVGFRLTFTDPVGVDAYNIQYSDDYGQTWKTAQSNFAVSGTGTTTWLDDGSKTSPGPLDVSVRWYRTVVAQSHKTFLGTAQNLSGGLTFAANGPAGKQLKVEVLDQNYNKAIFYINLTGSLMNYTLSLTGSNVPTGFDNTHIALVNFVSDKTHMGSSGAVSIETKGLNYVAPVTGATYDASLI
ncbi:MAG: hypothetical protein WCJ71_09165, partial [Candidatus Omnitrophota bacterium]